jgi:hypothetical protein
MRNILLASITSAAALLAGTLYVAAQVQPGGAPPTASPQGRQEQVAPGVQQPSQMPRQGTTTGQGTQPGATPRERQEQFPTQPGGRPANEAPQG